MTEVTIREQMTRMTRRAIAIPFQFLCGGLLPTSSCRREEEESDRRKVSAHVAGEEEEREEGSSQGQTWREHASSAAAAAEGGLMSSHHAQTNVTDKNGAHGAPLDRILDGNEPSARQAAPGNEQP